MAGLPNLIWPVVVKCFLIASLHGGPDPTKHAYEPLHIEPAACPLVAYLDHHSLILEKGYRRVEIPLPSHEGWHQLRYMWGANYATLDEEILFVRLGPTGTY
ncbi:MAG: hypothetical protein D6704_03635 [Nitrospirae bacterium]|nr:MAG: hypothetical protein D6704_03635 [Nitrospirota bacterium]